MDYLKRLVNQARTAVLIMMLLNNLVLVGGWYLTDKVLNLSPILVLACLILLSLLLIFVFTFRVSERFLEPAKAIWQYVLHLQPGDAAGPAPDLKKISFGRELVESIAVQLDQLVNLSQSAEVETRRKLNDLSNNFVAQNLPLPFLMLDPNETIKFANPAAAAYLGRQMNELINRNVYEVMDLAFPSEDTFDNWLKSVKDESATAVRTWERVKLNVTDNHPAVLFDLAAYYNQDNPEGNAIMLILFDHNIQYSQDEQAVSFLALSVHELRTPLTLLRGYIEVFEEELGGHVSPELESFMEKMHSQAEQLTAFVNNILNVARVDDDQLELKLQKADWVSVLKPAVESLGLRAKVRGMTLHCRFAKDLPPVAVDPLSIQEVISNLVDNAIKYSGKSHDINITTYLTREGMVETTVQDFGVGIPTSVLPNLFTKFYRDHHNRAQIGGTGLGLYLAKAIIKAHGGNLWVRSREGQGSLFGFTLMPFEQLSEADKQKGDQGIVRSAHGWIKNHSLYRR